MRTLALEDSSVTTDELVRMAGKGPLILTRKGQPVAAVKDLSGSDWESVSLANNSRFIALIEASRRDYREKGGISLEQVRKELGLAARTRKNRPKPASGRASRDS